MQMLHVSLISRLKNALWHATQGCATLLVGAAGSSATTVRANPSLKAVYGSTVNRIGHPLNRHQVTSMKSMFFLLFLVFPIDVMANDEIKSVEFSAQLPFDRVNDYVSQFQKAVKDRSCFRISALTDYPLTINHAGGSKQIWNRTALCRYCPALFNPARSAAVLNQNVLKIPVGSHGLMFGSGLFWIRPVCENDDENDVGDEELRCLTNKQGIVLKLQVANLSESVP